MGQLINFTCGILGGVGLTAAGAELLIAYVQKSGQNSPDGSYSRHLTTYSKRLQQHQQQLQEDIDCAIEPFAAADFTSSNEEIQNSVMANFCTLFDLCMPSEGMS